MISYLLFFLTFFFYVGLGILTATKPNLVGDNAMGYGLGLAFLGLGFAVSSLLLTIAINLKGGFNWLTPDSGLRLLLVLVAWFLIALTTFFCAAFKWEWHNDLPEYLHVLAVYQGQLWIPALWFVACAFSLNPDSQTNVAPNVYKIPFWISLGISIVFAGGLLFGYLQESAKQESLRQATRDAQEDEWHRKNLDEIAAHQPTDPIVTLLSFSTRYRPDDIRKAALAKIKTHPNWEAEILDLLQNKHAYREVYYFLDGNKVDHPREFAKPLNESILWVSEAIKQEMIGSNNLQHWSFEQYKIDRLLRAIDDQFLNQGVDFYPNVVKLKEALNTPPPERFKEVHFTITDVVDNWLDDHKK